MRAGIWESARCGRVRFNVLAATIGTIAFWKVAPIKTDPMERGSENGMRPGVKEVAAATIERNQPNPYQLTVDEALSVLGADAQRGLSEDEARARLKSYGKNELTEETAALAWRKFLAQFRSVLVILLLIATAISAGLWLYERESAMPYEALAIFAVVLINAVMGYVQEARAEEHGSARGHH